MSNYHLQPADKPAGPDPAGAALAPPGPRPGDLAADAAAPLDRRRDAALAHRGRRPDRSASCGRTPRAASASVIKIGTIAEIKAAELVAAIRPGLPGLLPGGARLHRCSSTRRARSSCPARTRPATAPRSTSAPCTSAARTSAASRTRASRTTGSSARATARATTGSGSRRWAPSTARRRGAWTASRSRSRTDGTLIARHVEDHARPAARRRRPARHHPAEEPHRLHMTDQTGDRPRGRAGAARCLPADPAASAVADRVRPSGSRRRRQTRAIGGLTSRARRPDRPPVRRRPLGRVPRRRRSSPCS